MILGVQQISPVENSMQADSKKAQAEVPGITLSNSSLEAASGFAVGRKSSQDLAADSRLQRVTHHQDK
jgi:hypothetical protein